MKKIDWTLDGRNKGQAGSFLHWIEVCGRKEVAGKQRRVANPGGTVSAEHAEGGGKQEAKGDSFPTGYCFQYSGTVVQHTHIDLSNFNNQNVTNMSRMF